MVGSPITREYAIGAGRTRAFEHGRIFYRYGVGARELHGTVLRAYIRRGHVKSRLGFPRTGPIRHTAGTYARFEKGTLFVYRSGKVRVTYYG